MATQYNTFAITDRGAARKKNEDQFLVASRFRSSPRSYTATDSSVVNVRGGDQLLLAVADGVGGHRGGEVASRIAVETLRNEFDKSSRTASIKLTPEDDLRRAVIQCNRNISDRSFEDPDLYGMATTLTVALIENGKVFIAHVGDSRCYLHSGSSLKQLTNDHTMAELIKNSRRVSLSTSHLLYNCIGGYHPGEMMIDFTECELSEGDTLVLTTDGLLRHVDETEIVEALRSDTFTVSVLNDLVGKANERGGRDNIAVVIVRNEPEVVEASLKIQSVTPVPAKATNESIWARLLASFGASNSINTVG
ncbi:PP2C family protein-serine/threonine phosphatase [Stieleria varia]|uniref:Serine/threonine phosphatase stp n=1 Tax=Stieleria varia TaxID=2528005 RepID=A0A5C6AJH2_9BACT|nr:protein phosphatase 2C domain-containing protein [Stieleria varia]TWT98353.1 Serine/threonine phosphatase stp [Stieleria varia]